MSGNHETPVGADVPIPAQRSAAPEDTRVPAQRASPENTGATAPAKRRRRRTSLVDKLLIGTGLGLALLVVVGLVGAHVVTNQVLGDVQRIPDVFGAINPATRPQKPAGAEKTLNFLLMGVDTGQGSGQQRSDVVMLVHVSADRRTASFVSVPRDTWVPVPGKGMNRINTAYSLGGGTLLVQTVEQLTNLRVDHFAVMDFAGFKGITDAFGGVDFRVPADSGPIKAGQNHLDGDATLAYLRRTDNRSTSELTQIRHQQAVIRALMSKANARGLLSSPTGTLHIADSVAKAVSVDDSLGNGDLRSLLLSMRNLKPGSISFVTAPVGKAGRVGGQSVVRLDSGAAAQLWKAVDSDAVPAYLESQKANTS
jgi:LCP family protein required for cell wall assembly